jgi:glycosyltransferase 2 family protein
LKTVTDKPLTLTPDGSPALPPVPRRFPVKNWRAWLGVLFSLFFLFLALRNINVQETLRVMGQTRLTFLGLAVLSYVLSVAAKSARWQLLLSAHKAPSYGRAFSIFSIGQMINSFLPGPFGELTRSYLLGDAEEESKVYVFGTVAVERIADMLFLLISLVILLSQIVLPDWIKSPARTTELALVVIVPLFILLVWQKNLVQRLVIWASRFLPARWREWVIRHAGFGLDALDAVRRPALLGGLIAWSLIVTFLSALTNYLVLLALGLTLPIWAALLLLVVLQIGTQIPAAPGGVGIFQYLIILTLSYFSVNNSLALGYSILLYLVISLPIVLIGGFSLWHEKITWEELRKAATVLGRLKTRSEAKPKKGE